MRSPDGRDVQLLSVGGRVLRHWAYPEGGAFAFAYLVACPAEFGGGRIAVLGFRTHYAADRELAGGVWAFDATGSGQEQFQFEPLTDELVPARMLRSGRHADILNPSDASLVADVFPELPGEEIVLVYDLGPWSQSALCVYDLSGSLLYCVWQDGGIHELYWLSDPGLLICLGADEQAKTLHPYDTLSVPLAPVVFAVRPRAGHKVDDWLGNQPGEGPSRPVWYRFLRPYTHQDLLVELDGRPALAAPWRVSGRDTSRCVGFHLQYDNVPGEKYSAGVSWLIDERGHEVPGSRHASDSYRRHLKGSEPVLPPLEEVKLGPPEWVTGPDAGTTIEPPPAESSSRPATATSRP